MNTLNESFAFVDALRTRAKLPGGLGEIRCGSGGVPQNEAVQMHQWD